MRGGLILADKAFREKSKIGEINIPILGIKPTQFQLYLDRIFNPNTQEGIPGLVKLIKKGSLIISQPKKDPQKAINRRGNKRFSDLARLVFWTDDNSIYAIAGTHRIAAIWIANSLYGTRDFLGIGEYDIANIDNLEALNEWRKEEFAMQKTKNSNIGRHYRGFDIQNYQKGFDNYFTPEYGGKRIFVEKRVYSWEDLIAQNSFLIIKRLKYALSKNLIKNLQEKLISADIISFLKNLTSESTT